MKQTHIVVIGGGIAGAAAANELLRQGHKVTIVEKNNRLGGRIHSITENGCTFELGASFLTDIYTNIFTFLKEKRLDKHLQRRKSKSAIVKEKKIYPISASTLLGNDLVSLSAKVQLLPEFWKIIRDWKTFDMHTLWKGYPYDKKTVRQSFNGKDGQELVNYLLQPMLDGYLYWSSDKTSEAMLLFILKFLRGKRYIYQPGLQTIPELLAKGSNVLLSQEVKEIKRISENEFEIRTNNKTLKADGIVCATTATTVPLMFKNLTNKQKEFFSSISYSTTVVVAKTYQGKTPRNIAIAYPRIEKYNLGTITINSDTLTKTTITKLYASGITGKALCLLPDKEIEKKLLQNAKISKDVFDFSVPSNSTYVQRWHEALPEFTVGHFGRLKDFREGNVELENERVVFAGDYIGGPFIEGAFTSGIQAAKRLHERISSL